MIIAAGLKSKLERTNSEISSSEILPVPNVSTKIETGSATPIAYANSISHLSANPDATMFLATYLEAYAAERSTFVGSFPENAPPPCLE